MKRIFIALILVLALASLANAEDNVQYFDEGYRLKSENGYWYLNSNHNLVYTCGGYFIVEPPRADSVKCPSKWYQEWIKMYHGKQFRDRLAVLAGLK